MRRRQSYFEKRPLLREEHFIWKRDFYKEKKILFEKKTSFQRRKPYLDNLIREEHCIRKRDFYKEKNKKNNSKRRLLFREENPIVKRDFY